MARRTISALFLLGVNIIPLLGVVFFGWNLFSILLLYWFESSVIGFFNIFKIGLAEKPMSDDSNLTINGRTANQYGKAYLIPFFIVHYGIFWIVHGVFVIAFFGFVANEMFGTASPGTSTTPGIGGGFSGFSGFEPVGVAIAAASLIVSHTVSFFVNFMRDEQYLDVSPNIQMFRPYPRVMVMHVTILGGGALAVYLGTPLAALILLVALSKPS